MAPKSNTHNASNILSSVRCMESPVAGGSVAVVAGVIKGAVRHGSRIGIGGKSIPGPALIVVICV